MLNIYIHITSIALMLFSCDRLEEVKTPDFKVAVERNTYAAGDSVRFTFSGTSDIISFYSGEVGNNYEYVDGRIAEPDYLISFETQSMNGIQAEQMRVLISKDFDGDYSIDGFHAATWVDITSKFIVAPPNNGSVYVASEMKSFSELLDIEADTTNLYFAVKQNVFNQSTHGKGNLNRLRKFTISSRYEMLLSKLYEHAAMEWQLSSTPNKQPNRASLENNTIMMRDSWQAEYYENDTEDWAVSKTIKIPRVLNMGPDQAVPIKGIMDVTAEKYTYVYKYPGKYMVVFRAINGNMDNQKEVYRTINITVTE